MYATISFTFYMVELYFARYVAVATLETQQKEMCDGGRGRKPRESVGSTQKNE